VKTIILFLGRDGWEMLRDPDSNLSDWSTLRSQPGQGTHSALHRFGLMPQDFPGGEPVAGHYRLLGGWSSVSPDSWRLDCSVVGPFASLEDALK
jgi:hypothetical protein